MSILQASIKVSANVARTMLSVSLSMHSHVSTVPSVCLPVYSLISTIESHCLFIRLFLQQISVPVVDLLVALHLD